MPDEGVATQMGGGDVSPDNLGGFDSDQSFMFTAEEGEHLASIENGDGLDGMETALGLQALEEENLKRQKAELSDDEDSDLDDLEDEDLSDIEDEDEDSEEEDDEDEDEVEDETPEPPKQTRASKRINQLVDQVKGYEQRIEQMQAQYDSHVSRLMQNQQQMYEAQLAEAQRSNAIMERQLQMLTGQKEEEEFNKLDPLDQFKIKQKRELMSSVQELVRKELQPLLTEQQQQKQQAAAERKKAAKSARFANYNRDADSVLAQKFPKVGDEDKQILKDLLITTAASYGKLPSQVSHVFDRAAKALGFQPKAKARKAKGAANTSKARKQLPRPPRGKGGAAASQRQATDYPDYHKMQSAGYRDYHEWRDAGCPLIK